MVLAWRVQAPRPGGDGMEEGRAGKGFQHYVLFKEFSGSYRTLVHLLPTQYSQRIKPSSVSLSGDFYQLPLKI